MSFLTLLGKGLGRSVYCGALWLVCRIGVTVRIARDDTTVYQDHTGVHALPDSVDWNALTVGCVLFCVKNNN